MAPVAEQGHANILPDPPITPGPVSVTMPGRIFGLYHAKDPANARCAAAECRQEISPGAGLMPVAYASRLFTESDIALKYLTITSFV
jgi:hypothetical protein